VRELSFSSITGSLFMWGETCLSKLRSRIVHPMSEYGVSPSAVIPTEENQRTVWNQQSGAHPASCPMGTGGPFPGAKALLGCDADHSPPSSAKVENE
jgi:hypothetical protein